MGVAMILKKHKNNLYSYYRSRNLFQKMFFGYFILILIPFTVFIIFLMTNYQQQKFSKYLADEQRLMQQEDTNFLKRLSQIEGYQFLFHNNRALINYLNGSYSTVSDELFYFTSEIRPLFSYITASDRYISDILVYTKYKPLVPLPSQLLYQEDAANTVETLPLKGEWTSPETEDNISLIFQAPIYNADHFKRIGYIHIRLGSSIFADYFLPAHNSRIRYLNTGGNWYILEDKKVVKIINPDKDSILSHYLNVEKGNKSLSSYRDGGLLVNKLEIDQTDCLLVYITPQTSLSGLSEFRTPILIMTALFLLLSCLYYLIISSFTYRLKRFAKYISKTDYNFLKEYKDEISGDEIGHVINFYNNMVRKISNLITDLNISEMKKSEANYFALQAQMQPHFLYNSLETARMMAEAGNDEPVSDFLFNLGGVIRYSFSSASTKNVNIFLEIETVKKYLELYKASSSGQIDYCVTTQGDLSLIDCPPFILQPLVENSIKHGVGAKSAKVFIEVKAQTDGKHTVITVSDNGIGIPPDTLEIIKLVLKGEIEPEIIQKTGSGCLGLRSIIKRIRDYYSDRAHFTLDSVQGSGTDIQITITERGN
jgi:two-component system sensor histidine kinase YesM